MRIPFSMLDMLHLYILFVDVERECREIKVGLNIAKSQSFWEFYQNSVVFEPRLKK